MTGRQALALQEAPANRAAPHAGILQRRCACGTHAPGGGTCGSCERKFKLRGRDDYAAGSNRLIIGATGDPLEFDADRAAEQALRQPPGSVTGRAPAMPQRRGSGGEAGAGPAPVSVERTLADAGRPLDTATRTDMEARFGYDFTGVRVHSGASAARSASDVAARAYTVGSSIVFGEGQFSPGSSEGRRLLAHELAHVVQQSAGGPALARQVRRSPQNGPGKTETDRGAPMPYREATELLVCIKFMGKEHADFCRRELAAGNLQSGDFRGYDPEGAPAVTPAPIPAPAGQEKAPTVPEAQAKPIRDKVEDLMSYHITDWAVRDWETLEALKLLSAFSEQELPSQLAQIGFKYINRLLDNLPESARTDATYQRIVTAMGTANVASFAQEQLSYGLFDWAVTDNETASVFDAASKMSPAGRETLFETLDTKGLFSRLISNATSGHHRVYIQPWLKSLDAGKITEPLKKLLGAVMEESPDDQIETLKLATAKRFNVTVNQEPIPKETTVEWLPSKIRELYSTWEKLPEAHVAANKKLDHIAQFNRPQTENAATKSIEITGGLYHWDLNLLAVNASDLVQIVRVQNRDGTISETKETRSDTGELVRHETGHAVDNELGWSRNKDEIVKPERGGWTEYLDKYEDCARDMIDSSAGKIKSSLSADRVADVAREMASAMKGQSITNLTGNIRGLDWYSTLDQPVQVSILADPALEAISVGFDANKPWFYAKDGGVHLGDYVYQEGYPHLWYRYRHEARSRKVSDYQFRDPSEWFGEAYDAYYDYDAHVETKGVKLDTPDHDTKVKLFDEVVDRMAVKP